MSLRSILLLGLVGTATALTPTADARPRDRDQEAAFKGTRNGMFVPLRAIEARIVPQMRGFLYLGPELNAEAGRYRLKFLRGSQLVWVDIDARTGHIVGKSGF